MWFFDWFVTYFEQLRSYFQSTADAIGGVPYVGASLASPFYWIASFFANLRTASQYASSWADSVYTSAASIFSGIQGYLVSTYAVLTASGSWFFGQVRGYIEATYWLLTVSAGNLVFWLYNSLVSTFTVLTASGSWFFGQVRGYIEATYWLLTVSAGNLFAWIKGSIDGAYWILNANATILFNYVSSGGLSAWITSWWTGQSSAVMDFITNQWGYLITSAFSFLNSNWSSFESSFNWLCGKLILLLIKNIQSFSGALWSLLEALLKSIQIEVK